MYSIWQRSLPIFIACDCCFKFLSPPPPPPLAQMEQICYNWFPFPSLKAVFKIIILWFSSILSSAFDLFLSGSDFSGVFTHHINLDGTSTLFGFSGRFKNSKQFVPQIITNSLRHLYCTVPNCILNSKKHFFFPLYKILLS